MSSDYYGGIAGDMADEADDDYEPCDHDCFDDGCEEGPDGRYRCDHQHCWNCGACGCPGYCDDEQTYNLRFAETGGEDPGDEAEDSR